MSWETREDRHPKPEPEPRRQVKTNVPRAGHHQPEWESNELKAS